MKRRILDLKGLILGLLFSRWRRHADLEEGYSVLLPTPMDMPFLLRYALEGLRHLDTTHCKQIVVIPDGWGDDEGRGLRQVVESAGDSRIELVELRPSARILVHRLNKSVGRATNTCHWAMIVEGIDATRCEYAFLHDADAFFVDVDGLERQYCACRDRAMDTLGVQARWDPFFEALGYHIPGTWELMFSTRWARRRGPAMLKGRWRSSPHGSYEFDTMLYPQYLDFPTGKVGVVDPPPRFVHFASAIITYRFFRDRSSPTVVDELFCLLALSLLEELLPGPDRVLPAVAELARGLTDPTAPITYDSKIAINGYPTFRRLIDDLCQAPIIQGLRAQKLRTLIRPFDEHFRDRANCAAEGEADVHTPRRGRRHGLA